jgi:hypothetical protein
MEYCTIMLIASYHMTLPCNSYSFAVQLPRNKLNRTVYKTLLKGLEIPVDDLLGV